MRESGYLAFPHRFLFTVNPLYAMSVLNRLTVTLPPDHAPEEADLLQGLLALHVSHGWEEQSLPTGELSCIVHTTLPEFCAGLAEIIRAALPAAALTQSPVEEKNWVEAWKEFFTPVEGGDHFLVLAPWMREELAALETAIPDTGRARIPIIIEPKTAFGTGHHDTTALCLEAVSRLYAAGALREGMRFLDLGAGSGILGLACAKLGLSGEGLDIDPPAVDNALENRAVNGISQDRFTVRLGSIEAAQGPYDLILANILAEPLKEMAPAIAVLPGNGGKRPTLVLSGLLTIQAEAVVAAYAAEGYDSPERLERGEWAALIFH